MRGRTRWEAHVVIDLFWLFFLLSALQPVLRQRMLETMRMRKIAKLERKRNSRVILLVHRHLPGVRRLSGDFFGFARDGGHHFVVVEAMIESTAVARYSRHCLEMLSATDPRVAARIREIAFETISRLERRMLTLGPMTALEKVGSFLLEMADRPSDESAPPARASA